MSASTWRVYLAGETQTDWRASIRLGLANSSLSVRLLEPICDDRVLDECGPRLLGTEQNEFWAHHKSAKLNAIRNRTMLKQADIVVVCFSEDYLQMDAAFESGLAVALGKPLITVHPSNLDYCLKDVDAAAMATVERPEHVVDVLCYIVAGELTLNSPAAQAAAPAANPGPGFPARAAAQPEVDFPTPTPGAKRTAVPPGPVPAPGTPTPGAGVPMPPAPMPIPRARRD